MVHKVVRQGNNAANGDIEPIGVCAFAVDLPRAAFRRRRHGQPLPDQHAGAAELASRLRRFALFCHLADTELAELAASARIQVFRAGETIWLQGETNRHVLFIECGLAKTARRNASGANRTYGLHGPGDSIGLYAIWAGMRYPTDAVALSEAMTVLQIDSAALVAFAERHPDMADNLMAEIGRFTEAFIRKIDVISAGTVPQRLATLMTTLLQRYGTVLPNRSAHLPVSLTLEHLSDIVDARVETVARVLGAWKRDGWLATDAEGYHFPDLDRLAALLPG